jgi:hypothetical protein
MNLNCQMVRLIKNNRTTSLRELILSKTQLGSDLALEGLV